MGLQTQTEEQFLRQVADFARLHRWLVAHFKPGMVPAKGGGRRWLTNTAYDAAGFPDLLDDARHGLRGRGTEGRAEHDDRPSAQVAGGVCGLRGRSLHLVARIVG